MTRLILKPAGASNDDFGEWVILHTPSDTVLDMKFPTENDAASYCASLNSKGYANSMAGGPEYVVMHAEGAPIA